jgi:hypothetical protein
MMSAQAIATVPYACFAAKAVESKTAALEESGPEKPESGPGVGPKPPKNHKQKV